MLVDTLGTITGHKIIDVKPEDVLRNAKNFEIIDVRTRDEFYGELGHIANAQLMCLQENFEAAI